MRYHSKVLHHHHPVLHPTPAWLILMYLWDAPQEQNLYQATEVHSQDWVEFHYRKHHTALCTRAHDQTSLEVVSAPAAAASSRDCHLHLLKVSILILCIIICVRIFCVCVLSPTGCLNHHPFDVSSCLNMTCVTSHKSFCVQVCVCVSTQHYCMFVLCDQSLSSQTISTNQNEKVFWSINQWTTHIQ